MPTLHRAFALLFVAVLLFCEIARAANTIDPNTTGATDVVQDPFNTAVTLTNPLPDPLLLGSDTVAIGKSASGELMIDAGSDATISQALVGFDATSTGVVTVDGAGSTWSNNSLAVGSSGDGTVNIQNGGMVTTLFGIVASEATSVGTVTVDGTSSSWMITSDLELGYSGDGTLNILNGGTVSNDFGYIGRNSGSNGTATVDGAGSTWTNAEELTLGGVFGSDGNGTLNIQSGGQVSVQRLILGSGGTGTVTVSGTDGFGTASELTSLTDVRIGNSTNGTLNIQNGGEVSNNQQSYIGLESGSVGAVIIDGAGSTWTNSDALNIGDVGNGTMSILNGGTVSNTAGRIGVNSGSTGIAIIDGAGSTWTNSGSLVVGDIGNGTLILQNGGTVSNVRGEIGAFSAGAIGAVTINGSGSTWTSTESLYVGGSAVQSLGTGTLHVQNNGQADVTNLLKVWNGGQVNLAGGIINAPLFELAGGTLSGFGVINAEIMGGSTMSAHGGVLAIGDAASAQGFTFTGTTNIANTATLEILDADVAEMGLSTTLAGGALVARNGMDFSLGDTVSGYGIVVGSVSGLGNFLIATVPSGRVDFRGSLDVGADTATIYSQGSATINGTLSFAGGSLITPDNSLLVGGSGTIRGEADLSGITMLGDIGSTIRAEGLLTVGNSSVVNGFYSNGTLEAAQGATLSLADANDAVLDSGALVTLGDVGGAGTLAAANGLTLDFGGNITGFGTIDTPNDSTKPLRNNGNIIGNSALEPITFEGYVKGVGTFSDVVFNGTFAPGLSPAAVETGNLAFGSESVLEIELGGLSPGAEYDQLLVDGLLQLDGTLLVTLLNGFQPEVGDQFEILSYESLSGTFKNVIFNGALHGTLEQGASSVMLTVVAVPEPGSGLLGVVALFAATGVFRRRTGLK